MKKVISLLISLAAIVTLFFFSTSNVYAQNDNSNFYDSSNTYEYNPNYEANSSRYFMDSKIASANVDSGEPLLTVFTHGLGVDASHWSNNGVDDDFSYSKDSLITKMAKMVDSNVYYAKVLTTDTSFRLNDITNEELYGTMRV